MNIKFYGRVEQFKSWIIHPTDYCEYTYYFRSFYNDSDDFIMIG